MDGLGIDTRRVGNAMLGFGVVGMVVAGLVTVGLIAGAIAARDLDERLMANQARLVQTLERVDSTMSQVVTTTDNAADTLTTTSLTLASAGEVLGRAGDTAQELSASIDISILGSRPLAGAAARFGELATDTRAFQDQAVRLSENLAVNAVDVRGLAGEIELLRENVAALGARVATFEATGEIATLLVALLVLLAVLAGWLAVAGAFCAWVGHRLRRAGRAAASSTPEPTAADRVG